MKIQLELAFWEEKVVWETKTPFWKKDFDLPQFLPVVVGNKVSFTIGEKKYTLAVKEVAYDLAGDEPVQIISLPAYALMGDIKEVNQDLTWVDVRDS